ncbi:MAG: FAD-dependent oxidoreductase [Nibricoccus sp.]
MDTLSYWRRTAETPHFPKLSSDINVDVAVIGGGITGVTTAYLLKQRGLKVALIERERCGKGDTGSTTAHLTCMPDARLRGVAKDFDRSAARAVWQAGAMGISKIYELVHTLEIDCHFQWVPGVLHAASDDDKKEISDEANLAAELGIPSEFRESGPYFGKPSVVFPNQAKFHPLRYLAALVAHIPGSGSYVFEESGVTEITDKPLTIKTSGGTVRSKFVVIATHTPLAGVSSTLGALMFQTKLAPYSSYVLGATVSRGTIPSALYWDTADPYRHLRVESQGDHDYIIFGGADHKTGQVLETEKRFGELEADLHRFVPGALVATRWSGQVIETSDGLPFIGQTSENQFIATGFAGNGMTFGTLSAIMATDFVSGRPNDWAELFRPGRAKVLGGALTYIAENKDFPVHLVCGHLSKDANRNPESLQSGEGAVIRIEGKHTAIYKDGQGNLHACSAVCPHLGCIVGWNVAEKTWDCPCHGSRFHATGEVMAGPAENSLERMEIADLKPT